MSGPRRPVVIGIALTLTMGLAAQPARAQIRLAPQVAWGGDQNLAVGGRLLLDLSRLSSSSPDRGLASKIDFVLPFDWFVDCGDCTYFEVTPSLILPLTIKDTGPYLGAGLNIARLSLNAPGEDQSDIHVGLGLTGGVLIPIKSFTTFGEVRFTAGGAKQTVVTVGFYLGRKTRVAGDQI